MHVFCFRKRKVRDCRRLSLKISLKNTPRSAQELNDDCFTTLSKYFSSVLVALFFTSNMLLIKTEGSALEDDWVLSLPGALVLKDVDNSVVLWKKSAVFHIFTFFAAASSIYILPLTSFFKIFSTPFSMLMTVLNIQLCPWREKNFSWPILVNLMIWPLFLEFCFSLSRTYWTSSIYFNLKIWLSCCGKTMFKVQGWYKLITINFSNKPWNCYYF